MDLDILLCSVPWVESERPVLAPAVLKSAINHAGYRAKTLDLGFHVWKKVNAHPDRTAMINFFQTQEMSIDIVDPISDIIEECADMILTNNARIIGLSLLSQDSQFFNWWLCYHLKSIDPDIKIIIGGSGIKNFIAQSDLNYAQEMRKRNLIDAFIVGDGEKSIVEYLNGNLEYPGINSDRWLQIDNLSELPFADFDDYQLHHYIPKGIPICDSRGCVRSCEFCDIIEHWKKYKYRTADHIFDEMMYQIDRHGIKNFYFYNSLTNGNMKEFNKLLDKICEYNSHYDKKEQISWDGYFIVRNQKQHPESLWEKIKKSNGMLQLGIESVVEHVRIGLGKNFYNVDIDYHLEMAQKYEVPLMLLMIIGYPTETLDDFEFTKKWFKDREPYMGMPVKSVQCTLASILPGTELERNQQKYGIDQGELPVFWMNRNTKIDQHVRLQHYEELNNILSQMGVAPSSDQLTKSLIEAS